MMPRQLLRNEQDTRTLCGVVFDTDIVSSQLNAGGGGAVRGPQRRSATEGPWSRFGTTVHLGVGGFDPRTHHGRNEAGRGTGAALGSHGTVHQAVDRGKVRDGQTLSNRQDFPATAVQGHSRRRNAASALCGARRRWKRHKEKVSKDKDFERHWHENFETGWRS